MQKVTVLCVGKLKERFYAEAAAEYAKRLSRFCQLEIVELPEERLPDNPSQALIDQGILDALRADAAAGREAKATLESDRRDAIVDKAIAEGRIAPASRASWRDMCDVDEEGTKKLLASLEPNTIPVAEIGVGLNPQDLDEDTKLMSAAGWASADTDKETR